MLASTYVENVGTVTHKWNIIITILATMPNHPPAHKLQVIIIPSNPIYTANYGVIYT